jgi:pimeloyl-ACP methyl ester carboxylesterase
MSHKDEGAHGHSPDPAHRHGHDHAHGHAHDHEHEHAHGHAHDAAHAHGHDGGGAHDHPHHAEPDVVKEEPFGPPKKMVPVGDGVELACVDAGNGPPILFLHGFPTSGYLFRAAIADLADAHRCIAPDLLGLGDSTGPLDSDYSLPAQADRMARLLDELGIREATVVGHDLGGGVAQHLVASCPDRVSRLVLVDTVAYDNWPVPAVKRLGRLAWSRMVFDLAVETGLFHRYAASRRGLRAGVHDPETLTDAAIGEYLRPALQASLFFREPRERMRRFALALARTDPPSTLEVVDALREWTKPTLVVWGADDPYFSVSWGKRLADEIPGCTRLEIIPFCGHLVPEERPHELAILVGELVGCSSTPAAAPATAGA